MNRCCNTCYPVNREGRRASIPAGEDDGLLEAAVELRAPRAAGAYRIFWRLLAGPAADAPTVSGTNELFAEFSVL